MNHLVPTRAGLAVLCILAAGLRPSNADAPKEATAPPVRKAVERGLAFLQADAAKWRKEHQCSTCHHGAMTVWALAEAKGQGYDVPADGLADAAKWTRDRLLERIDLPRDERPGWRMVNTPALYLSLMALNVPKQDAVSADDLKRIAGHLLRHQEADGSWAWSSAPSKNRPPPVFESDEVATLLGSLALHPRLPTTASKEKSDVRDSYERAAAWLAKATPTDTTQAVAMRLLVKARTAGKVAAADVGQLLGRQNKDGGWSQVKGIASDAFATGQALYVLNLSGVTNDRPEVQRGVAFLVTTQKDDGSWAMTPRSHPDTTPMTNTVPITYFGSAWGTIGLVRSSPR